MSQSVTDDLAARPPMTCSCRSDHRPDSRGYVDVHHLVPKSWGGKDVAANRIPLCPTTHRLTHEILMEAVRRQAWPSNDFLKPFPHFARYLAERAIQDHGGIPPKHTPSGVSGTEAP